MTDSSKRSLEQIVSEAQTLPPGEQLRFIRDACASDADLYASALYQLHSRQQWADLDAFDAGIEQPSPRIAGEMIGPYRILRSLGTGGMGEVFLAERADEQFQQQVAIKLVKPGLLSRHVQGRLRQERQILASLEHPNIARLYDGGTTPDGTPYLVMEYVDGEPIDIFCNRRQLNLDQRLRIFLQVCAAVHRAHQNLVVHRDLKPSNILVTADSKPKLLDFGIAKLLDERQVMHTLAVTQADVRVMTPDHASPEQIRGEPVTTASDIYVLGVLLYELLSGFRPFRIRGNRLAELERAICEETPPTMSAAVDAARESGDGIVEIAAERSVSEGRLSRQLHGDLDRIVMMAMRKEPQRRYSSVEQFAADIENYLRGMPIMARPDAWGYRAGKFIRRHTVAVALSTAFLALLVGFTITTYVQSRRIEHERDVAQAERQRAEAEREHAEAVSSFLVDSFRLADPSQSKGKNITAREILDSGALRITRELQNQPSLQATLLDTIGSVYLGLGEFDEAQPLIEQGLSVRRALDANSVDVARSLYNLNRVYEKRGDLDTAERLAHESLDIDRARTGETSLETASSLCRLGTIQFEKDELSAAQTLFQQCLDIRTAKLGTAHELLTVPLDNLARVAQARGNLAESEKLLRRSMDIDLRTRGADHPLSLQHAMRLALVIYDQGNVPEAEKLYRQSVAGYQRVFGVEHPETLDAMSAFGMFLLETDRLDEAQRILENVLAVNRRLRPQHAYVGNDLELLGRLAFRRGDFPRAEQLFNESLAIYSRTLPACHGFIAAASTMLGRTQLELNLPRAAEKTLDQAVKCWRIEYRETPNYAVARAALARSWALQRKYAEAEPVLLESYPVIAQATARPYREAAVVVHGWIEDLFRSTDRPAESQEYFRKLARAD